MATPNLFIFQQQITDLATELIAQESEKFNAASGGTILLGSGDHIGDYVAKASFGLIDGLIQDRNVYEDKDIESKILSQILERMIKIDRRIGPLDIARSLYSRAGLTDDNVIAAISAQAAKGIMVDYLNTSIGAAASAISKSTDSRVDLSGAKGAAVRASLRGLNQGSRLFGDAFSKIKAWIISGSVFHDLNDNALQNTEKLYSIENVSVQRDNIGRIFIVSDIPALMDKGLDHVIGLTTGAVAIETRGITDLVIQDVLLKTNLKKIMQGESNYSLGLKGFEFSATVKSPTTAQVIDPKNWTRTATSVKDTAGVVVTFGEKAV